MPKQAKSQSQLGPKTQEARKEDTKSIKKEWRQDAKDAKDAKGTIAPSSYACCVT